jgi:hypothetical protein
MYFFRELAQLFCFGVWYRRLSEDIQATGNHKFLGVTEIKDMTFGILLFV